MTLRNLELESVPRPVGALADEYPADFVEPRHRHARAQLLYAVSGVMSVATERESFFVTPRRALWMPAHIDHEISCRTAVSVRTVYWDTAEDSRTECSVIEVSELLRALILEVMAIPREYPLAGREDRIVELLLDCLDAPSSPSLCAPMPQNQRLIQVCQALIADPKRADSIDDWAALACVSRRTFTRQFREQTGMSLAEWRQQVRLLEAIARLHSGQPVTTTAFDVGYESPSAFAAAFQRAFGVPPSCYANRVPGTIASHGPNMAHRRQSATLAQW